MTGWTGDTLAGPAFRLVTTVIAAAPVAARHAEAPREGGACRPGGTLRTFFQADSGRPFALTVETGGRAERALAFLHEPDGMPFRDESAPHGRVRPAVAPSTRPTRATWSRRLRGGGRGAAQPGASPSSVAVSQSPLTLRAVARRASRFAPSVTNVTGAPVEAEVGMHLGGAARIENVAATRLGEAAADSLRGADVVPRRGGGHHDGPRAVGPVHRLRRDAVRLARAASSASSRSTMPSAACRSSCPRATATCPVTLGLFPGFADCDRRPAVEPPRLDPGLRRHVGRARARRQRAPTPIAAARAPPRPTFALPAAPWPMGAGFVPLGLLVAARGRPELDPGDRAGTARHGARAVSGVRREPVRIAAGQGFWGDWLEAPVRQVRGGPIDYLMMDYLAEVTMSIMQKQKSRDPTAGYARDFVPLMERILPDVVAQGHPGHLQRRRREPARLRRGGAGGGAAAGAAAQAAASGWSRATTSSAGSTSCSRAATR